MVTLSRAQWSERLERHRQRVDSLLDGHRWRSDRGVKHPIEDFLFEYYSFKPSQLRRWHPGHGVLLADAAEWKNQRDYRAVGGGVRLDTSSVLRVRSSTVAKAYALLRATTDRRPAFGCFGMHEWAMVDGLDAEHTRHPQLGLRVTPKQIGATIRAVGVRCTHIDAYRFFTPSAKPLNEYAPTRADQVLLDQPGCLHVGMDLYRIAYKLSPMIESELVVDCFELARWIRVLDMRASPYNLAALDLAPVPVETAEGRAEYVAAQREFAGVAAPLRRRLLERIEALPGTQSDTA